MKKIVLFFALIMITASTVMLSSCSKDDDPVVECKFVTDFPLFEANGGSDNDKKMIEQIYLHAIGVTSSEFTISGTETECKDKVVEACQKAQKDIENSTFKCRFTFQVLMINNMRTIYSYSYNPKTQE